MYTYGYTYLYRYMYPKRTDACSQAPKTCPMAGPWLRGENGVVSCAGAYSRQGAGPVTLLLIGWCEYMYLYIYIYYLYLIMYMQFIYLWRFIYVYVIYLSVKI